jgi:hypothetical protein
MDELQRGGNPFVANRAEPAGRQRTRGREVSAPEVDEQELSKLRGRDARSGQRRASFIEDLFDDPS